MSVITRFAPSPTGLLHVGNARIALMNWLLARQADGGRFVLRIDDTDAERSRPEFAAAIETDLTWLGLEWDTVARQSERLALYSEAADRLREAERLYPCYDTPEELKRKRKAQRAAGRPPIYDRLALKLSQAEKAEYEAEGRKPHWRFFMQAEEVSWHDGIRGAVKFEGAKLGDPVLIRGDGSFLYTLPSVVDDIDLAVSHVLRGEDHVTNSAVQRQIFQALGKHPGDITFSHMSLLLDADGGPLSKRLGGLALAQLRQAGVEAMAVNSLLAALGSADAVEARESLAALLEHFDLSRFSRNPPRFVDAELSRLNAQLLHDMPFDAAYGRLGISAMDAAFWHAVRQNLGRLEEAREWWELCNEPLAPIIEDGEFLAAAAALLPGEPWDETVWAAWTGALKEQTGRRGKALFHPLRLALTARERGPELRDLLLVIGRARALARLRGETA